MLVFFPEMPVSAFFLTTTLSVDLVCNEIYSRNLQYLDLPRLVRLPLFGVGFLFKKVVLKAHSLALPVDE